MSGLVERAAAARRSHRPAPKWRDGATPDEVALVAEIDARLDAIATERAELTRARSLLTNRCCQRAIQAERAPVFRASGAAPSDPAAPGHLPRKGGGFAAADDVPPLPTADCRLPRSEGAQP